MLTTKSSAFVVAPVSGAITKSDGIEMLSEDLFVSMKEIRDRYHFLITMVIRLVGSRADTRGAPA